MVSVIETIRIYIVFSTGSNQMALFLLGLIFVLNLDSKSLFLDSVNVFGKANISVNWNKHVDYVDEIAKTTFSTGNASQPYDIFAI